MTFTHLRYCSICHFPTAVSWEFYLWLLEQQEKGLSARGEEPLEAALLSGVPLSSLCIFYLILFPGKRFFHKPFGQRRHFSCQPLTLTWRRNWCEIHAKYSRPYTRDRQPYRTSSSSKFLSSCSVFLARLFFRATQRYFFTYYNVLFILSDLNLEEVVLMPSFN